MKGGGYTNFMAEICVVFVVPGVKKTIKCYEKTFNESVLYFKIKLIFYKSRFDTSTSSSKLSAGMPLLSTEY